MSDPLPQSRPMPDPHNLHGIRLDPIPDQIGRHCRQFPQSAGRSTSLRMFGETIACEFQPLRHALRRQRPKLVDVPLDRGQIGQRPERPDYLNHDAGGGASSGVPQVSSHRATSSWETTRPASMSARPSASAAASASSSTSLNRVGSGFTERFYHLSADQGTASEKMGKTYDLRIHFAAWLHLDSVWRTLTTCPLYGTHENCQPGVRAQPLARKLPLRVQMSPVCAYMRRRPVGGV